MGGCNFKLTYLFENYNFTMRLVSVLLFMLWCWCGGARAQCVMRGECYTVGGHQRNCVYEGPALPVLAGLEEEQRLATISNLARRCPHLILDDDGNVKPDGEILTCCDAVQIQGMADSLLLADGVLGRCPTCVRNYARQICEMNCAPDQARFVNITAAVSSTGVRYVDEVDYRMHDRFMEESHASCREVLVPQTGLPAINLMCGTAPVCTPQAWYDFSGDTQVNPYTPVQVNFLAWPTEEDSMNVRALRCNETMDGDLPCGCVDCNAICPLSEIYVPEICTVLSIHCYSFISATVFFIVSVALFVFLSVRENRKRKKSESKSRDFLSDQMKPQRRKAFTYMLQKSFSTIGGYSANHTVLIIMLSSWLVLGMAPGLLYLRLTSNPIELWSSPNSQGRANLDYFNSRFGPFYRAAQVYLQITGLEPFTMNNISYGPAFRIEAFEELVKLENAIFNIGRDDGGVVLEDVCFAPLRSRTTPPRLDLCVHMSPSTYLPNPQAINNNTYLSSIQNCINNHFAMECLNEWGGGSEPDLAFGGFDDNNILSADTLLINLPISNFLLDELLEPVLEWEKRFLELMHDYEANWKADFVTVAFGAERSVEDEIERVSRAEVIPIIISYLLMFIYITMSLGNIRNCKLMFIDSKICVGLGSIFIVLISIFCGMCVCGYIGITLTLLSINVIPFFVLSVGVDNVFLMVNTMTDIVDNIKDYEGYKDTFDFFEKRTFIFEQMMRRVGPSIFVTAVIQITCFGIGSLARFPAVVTLSVLTAISLAFLFIFQITLIIAVLAVDYRRSKNYRYDVFCFIKKKVVEDDDVLNSKTPYRNIIAKWMVPYSEFLLQWWVKLIVVVMFMALLCVSVYSIPHIEIGLDQSMALPEDSYVYRYLVAVDELLRLGPPVYFVLKGGLNFSDVNHQNTICGSQLCYDDSLFTQIFLASQQSDITYISKSSNSWMDDFFDWVSLTGACCKYNTTDGSFCPSISTSMECAHCQIGRNEWQNGLRPSPEAFEEYIPFFLQDEPSDVCTKGGLASYFSNVNYVLDSEGRATVYDTNFMAYHNPLSSSKDYITAVKYAYEISENITRAIQEHTGTDVEVFPYSVFYVYFEQYLTMWADTFRSLGFCMIGVLVITAAVSGFDWVTTLSTMVVSLMVVLDMMGVMYIWSIPLNAVSCVILIVSICIAVEFSSHILYAYSTSNCPPGERVQDALQQVGSTIIYGITLTNIPIIVLAFSYTEIIKVFFFRMLFSLVILGFLHAMVFLPVLLSYLDGLRSKSS